MSQPSESASAEAETCAAGCGQPIEFTCETCKAKVCDDSNCHTDTVVGILCGTYTQWGCARKYTNCNTCYHDLAMHEGDMVFCEECNILECPGCAEEHCCEEQPKSEEEQSN
jgi:hypothetical protein